MSESIIPKFMAENPSDTFQFLMPLKLILDHDDFGNSHYEIVIKNLKKNEVFTYQISPELLFTHFHIGKSYINGKETKFYSNKTIIERSFDIDTELINNSEKNKLKNFLDDDTIGTLLGWNKKYLNTARNINCHILDYKDSKIIIPHYAIGIYYYFRFSELRKSALSVKLEELFILFVDNPSDAMIVLPKKRNDIDAAFIYRYASQKHSRNEFDNIGRYILNYLEFMQKENIDVDLNEIHLKINFPTKEKFKIEARVSEFIDKNTHSKYYYLHEITNDYSSIGFKKLTKITEKINIIPRIDDFENLPVVENDIPTDTTDILEILNASRRHTSINKKTTRKKNCGSLENLEITNESISKDIILDILNICQEKPSDESINQSTTQSSQGNLKTRKINVSSEFIKDRVKNPLNEIDNFTVFKQYINYLDTQNSVTNLSISETKNIEEYKIVDSQGREKINDKCKIRKRPRQYLTVRFNYNNYHVGMLELENKPSGATSTWIIISIVPLVENTFKFFIDYYMKDNFSIPDMIKNFSNSNPKFTKKNHERTENLSEKQLSTWSISLLKKITI